MVSNSRNEIIKIGNRLQKLEKIDSYNRFVYSSVKEFLGKRILDLGSGIGSITKFFLDKDLIVGVDASEKNVQIMEKRFKTQENFKAIKFDIEGGDYSRLKGFNFDTVFSSNVLEHIKDDMAVLKKIHSLLPNNGKIVLFLPALKALYGSMDEGMHYRRYDKKTLEKKLENAGFQIEKTKYVNLFGIFYWYFFGKILKKSTDSGVSFISENKAIKFFILIYTKLESHVSVPLGLSICCIGRKKL